MHDKSSIVKWGYQDNFKPVFFFFFYEKNSHVKKAINAKQMISTLFKVFKCTKAVAFVFCLLIFVLVG